MDSSTGISEGAAAGAAPQAMGEVGCGFGSSGGGSGGHGFIGPRWTGLSHEDIQRFCRPHFDAASLAAAQEYGWDEEDLAVSEADLLLLASLGRVAVKARPTCRRARFTWQLKDKC